MRYDTKRYFNTRSLHKITSICPAHQPQLRPKLCRQLLTYCETAVIVRVKRFVCCVCVCFFRTRTFEQRNLWPAGAKSAEFRKRLREKNNGLYTVKASSHADASVTGMGKFRLLVSPNLLNGFRWNPRRAIKSRVCQTTWRGDNVGGRGEHVACRMFWIFFLDVC